MGAPFEEFSVEQFYPEWAWGYFSVDCSLPENWRYLTRQERELWDKKSLKFIKDAIREKLDRERED